MRKKKNPQDKITEEVAGNNGNTPGNIERDKLIVLKVTACCSLLTNMHAYITSVCQDGRESDNRTQPGRTKRTRKMWEMFVQQEALAQLVGNSICSRKQIQSAKSLYHFDISRVTLSDNSINSKLTKRFKSSCSSKR